MLQRDGRGGQFPYPSVLESTGTKTDSENGIWKKVSYLHSMTCSLLNKERNPGHLSSVTWRDNRRRKSNDWPANPWRQNAIFLLEKFGKESSVFGQKSAEKDADLSWLQEGHSPIKREKEIWTLKLVKDKYNLNCFPSTNS